MKNLRGILKGEIDVDKAASFIEAERKKWRLRLDDRPGGDEKEAIKRFETLKRISERNLNTI